MLRATNTGATGIINERGRIVQLAPMHRTVGLLDMAQGFTGATPYVQMGNLPTLLLCGAGVLLVLCAAVRNYRARFLLSLSRPLIKMVLASGNAIALQIG